MFAMTQASLFTVLTAVGVGGLVCLLLLLVPNPLGRLEDRLKHIGDKGTSTRRFLGIDRRKASRAWAREALPQRWSNVRFGPRK